MTSIADTPGSGLRCAGVAMVRNEADVIELWARYNLRVLDSLHVIDHGSQDNTAHILRQLQAEGLPIELHHWDDPAHTQAEAMRDIARPLASAGQVDYLIPLDADELLATDRHELRQSLACLPEGHAGAMRWRTYLPEGDGNDPFFFRRMWRYRSLELKELSKMIAPAQSLAHYTWSTGSHYVLRETDGEILPSAPLPFALAHYPIRSLEQLQRKVMVGAHASRLKATRVRHESWHWLDLEARLGSENANAAGVDLVQIALGYSYSNQAEFIAQQEIIRGPVDAAPGMAQRYRAQPLSLDQIRASLAHDRKKHAMHLAQLGRAEFNAGNQAWRAQDFAVALDRYTEAAWLNPDLAVAHLGRARCLSQRGQWDQAQEAFVRVLQIEPAHYSAWLELGHLHRRQGRLIAAVQAYRQAIEAQPGRFEAPLGLARTLGQMGQTSQAQEAYKLAQRKALGDAAPDRQAWQRLAQVHDHMASYRLEWGDRSGARQALAAALHAAQGASDQAQAASIRQALDQLNEAADPPQAGA